MKKGFLVGFVVFVVVVCYGQTTDTQSIPKMEYKGSSQDHLWQIYYSSSGRRIMSEGYSGSIISIWNPDTGQLLRSIDSNISAGELNRARRAVTFSPDENSIACAGEHGRNDNRLTIFDARSGSQIKQVKLNVSLVYDISWSPNGNYISLAVSASALGGAAGGMGIMILNAQNLEITRTFSFSDTGGGSGRWSRFSYDSKRLLTFGDKGIINIFNVENWERINTIYGPEGLERAVFSPDGNYVLGATRDYIMLWNAGSGEELWSKKLDGIKAIDFKPDGAEIVSITYSEIYILTSKDGTIKEKWSETLGLIVNVEFIGGASMRPDGKRAAITSSIYSSRYYSFIKIIDLETGADLTQH